MLCHKQAKEMYSAIKYLSTPPTEHVHTVLILLPGLVSAVSIIKVATVATNRDSQDRVSHDVIHHVVVNLLPARRALDIHGLQAGLTRSFALIILFLLLGDVCEEDSISNGFGRGVLTRVLLIFKI